MEYSGSSCSTARATVMPPMPESKIPIMGKDYLSVKKVKREQITSMWSSKNGHFTKRIFLEATVSQILLGSYNPNTNDALCCCKIFQYSQRCPFWPHLLSYNLRRKPASPRQPNWKTTLYKYLDVYNHHIPQRALSHQTPFYALKKWQKETRIFVKHVYKQTGLDN